MPLGAARLTLLAKTEAAVAAGRTPLTITAQGNAQMDTSQYKFGGSSANFDGVGDYLDLSAQTIALEGDWTFETWIRSDVIGSSDVILRIQTAADAFIGSLYLTNGKIATYIGGGGTTGTTVMSADTWYHVAWCRDNGIVRMYIDGVQDATRSYAVDQSATNLYIGHFPGDANTRFNGWLDEVRLSNTARYPDGTSFTPPTATFTNDANTSLLLHMEGYDTNFIDDVGIGVRLGATAWTYSPDSPASVGTGKISNSYKWTGSGAPNYSGVAIGYGRDGKGYIEDTEEWTLEFWLRKDNDGSRGMTYFSTGASNFSYNTLTTSDFTLYDDDGSYKFRWPNNTQSNVGALSDNVWYHFAIVCDGSGNVTVYRDGSTYTSKTGLSWTAFSEVYFGCGFGTNASLLSGNFAEFDEIRHSSTQRYTTSFTPETTAFTDDENTYGLLHCDASPENDDIADSY